MAANPANNSGGSKPKGGSKLTKFIMIVVVILLAIAIFMLIFSGSGTNEKKITGVDNEPSTSHALVAFKDPESKTPVNSVFLYEKKPEKVTNRLEDQVAPRTIAIKPGRDKNARTRVKIPLGYRIEWGGPKQKLIYVWPEGATDPIEDHSMPGEYHNAPDGRWIEFASGTGKAEEVDISFISTKDKN